MKSFRVGVVFFFLINFFAPGALLFYSGNRKAAIKLEVLLLLVLFLGSGVLFLNPYNALLWLVLGGVALLGIQMYNVFMSLRIVFGHSEKLEGSSPVWSLVYTLNVVGFSVLILWALSPFRTVFFLQTQNQMLPNIDRGEIFTIDRTANCFSCDNAIKVGDVIVYSVPQKPEIILTGRVVAIPESTVEVKDEKLIINNVEIEKVRRSESIGIKIDSEHRVFEEIQGDRQYLTVWGTSPSEARHGYPTEVKKGHVYVLSDNRDYVRDSRVYGVIPEKSVHGRVIKIIYSKNFSRVGKKI